jgi:hypothetical protein
MRNERFTNAFAYGLIAMFVLVMIVGLITH